VPRARRRFQAVLFDLGGTLVDTRDPVGWSSLAASLGVVVDPEHLLHAYDEVDRSVDGPPPFPPFAEYWRRIFSKAADAELPLSFAEAFLERSRALPDVTHLFSDAKRCLDDLRAQKRRMGVVSNSRSEAAVRAHLARAGIETYFSLVVSSGTEGVAKPDRAIFDRAVERLGIPAEATFYVGDLAYWDAIAAKSAGLASVWLNRYGTGFGEDPPEITSLAELPEYILAIEGARVK